MPIRFQLPAVGGRYQLAWTPGAVANLLRVPPSSRSAGAVLTGPGLDVDVEIAVVRWYDGDWMVRMSQHADGGHGRRRERDISRGWNPREIALCWDAEEENGVLMAERLIWTVLPELLATDWIEFWDDDEAVEDDDEAVEDEEEDEDEEEEDES